MPQASPYFHTMPYVGFDQLAPQRSACPVDVLILDLGDVIFHWSTKNLTALSQETFQAVLLTPAWSELERGKINEEEALGAIGDELSIKPADIRNAISECRKTLSVDNDLITKLESLKSEMKGELKVYAM